MKAQQVDLKLKVIVFLLIVIVGFIAFLAEVGFN